MGLTVTLIAGPRGSGKTTVVRTMIAEVLERPPFYVRLALSEAGVRLPTRSAKLDDLPGVMDAQWICYDRERIFELLPEAMAAIYRRERYGRVIIEADSDPTLRHAYPYDQQVFVVPGPRSLREVFRTPGQAARALQDALDDTSEFAAEVFGLSPTDFSSDDDSGDERALLTKSQIRLFLDSPLGDQLANQIQLQSAYQGLVESDIALINTAFGEPAAIKTCCDRIKQLLNRTGGGQRREVLYCCNPLDRADPERAGFLDALRQVGARKS